MNLEIREPELVLGAMVGRWPSAFSTRVIVGCFAPRRTRRIAGSASSEKASLASILPGYIYTARLA